MTTKLRKTVELEELRARLQEAEETLAAIRSGEVDSLVVTGPHGDQVFSLHSAEQPYRVFVEQMQEGALTLTPDGGVLYANQRFAEMVGQRLEKVIGSPLRSFLSEQDAAQLQQILTDPLGKKARFALDANGQRTSAQFSFSRLPIDDIEAICVVVTDLTEQEEKRELSAALQGLRAAQEQLTQQNRELAEARRIADAANESKDQFLAALSHELRTPLTPVLVTVTSLERDPTIDPPVREQLSMLRRNIELEARLIDDLLDLTRIARGKIEFNPTIVDAHAAARSAIEICLNEVAAKRLQLVQSLDARRCHIRADAVRVQQIFWNLIRNAVKFTPPGGSITIRSENTPDQRLRISVVDTGIGIEPETMSKLFMPFEQADRLITRQFGGLGLGLAISKRLTELQGGTLKAFSEGRDRGATFVLELPTVAPPTSVEDHAQSAPAAPPRPRRLSILLVEDHYDTRRSMTQLLKHKYAVHDVQDMASALNAARSERFDLVISDLGLPDGSGLDLMRQLRELYDLKGICLSGFGMEDDVNRSFQAGFVHHLTKPIDLRRLEQCIDALAEA